MSISEIATIASSGTTGAEIDGIIENETTSVTRDVIVIAIMNDSIREVRFALSME